MNKTLTRRGSPEAVPTDRLRSYRPTLKDLGIEQKQQVGLWANNRVENSHYRSDEESARCSDSGE